MKNKIYFASPFFNPEQVEREERLKAKLRDLGFEVFSPKEAYFCKPDESEEVRQIVFNGNCEAIQKCDILFAVTDGKDMGTIWESGYVNGINSVVYPSKKKIIVYYCETLPEGGKFNLMLAQSGDIIITDYDDMDQLPNLIKSGEVKKYHGEIE